ncbi:MAG: hypothetical protein WAN65_23695 [Candidatus Sulfotelmatobacter sp.]|jgi:hypothetical protein
MRPETLTPREVLDGLVERRLRAFAAETDATEPRVLLVPFHITECPATALLICRGNGLLRSKLSSMSAEDAHYTYLTTITRLDPEN